MRTLVVSLMALLLATAGRADGLDERAVKLPAYQTIPRIGQYASPEDYAAAVRDTRFRLTRVSYESDGLTVFAYVYAPAKAQKAKQPVVIFNRGSYVWNEFAGEYLTTFHRLAAAGFIVIAPMYRGSGGAAGRDELGGADLDDLLNTVAVIRQLPGADAAAVFMYGESRGAMMTYQAIRERYPMRAAAAYGGFTDLRPLAAPGGKFARATQAIWPDYAEHENEIASRRSAVDWADKFDVPVLIMHGGADQDVSPSHSLALAQKLQALGKPYQLIIRAGANHNLSGWVAERDAQAIEWFRQHMKKEP
jgi:dipeptidyl aminopeptidase/acylaminoacyl peptidase